MKSKVIRTKQSIRTGDTKSNFNLGKCLQKKSSSKLKECLFIIVKTIEINQIKKHKFNFKNGLPPKL